jgi:hypothetical protein
MTVLRQYGDPTERQAHLAMTANEGHDSDALSDTDGEFGADDEFAKRLYAFHRHPDKNHNIGTFMNITMPVTPKYVKAFLTLPTNAEHLGVADDGAMSHALGKVWQVQADTGRHVNLIGADQLTFRKNNLSVVSAIAKAYPGTGPPVILLAHESPLKPDADFTLLSEYQLRDNGCLLDSVSKKHKTVQVAMAHNLSTPPVILTALFCRWFCARHCSHFVSSLSKRAISNATRSSRFLPIVPGAQRFITTMMACM